MWEKNNKKNKLVGKKGYVIYDFVNNYFSGNFYETPEEAFEALLDSSFKEDRVVVEIQFIGQYEAHICFCKQDHCCCRPQ